MPNCHSPYPNGRKCLAVAEHGQFYCKWHLREQDPEYQRQRTAEWQKKEEQKRLWDEAYAKHNVPAIYAVHEKN